MSSSKNWELHIDTSVLKALKKVPGRDVEALLLVIGLLSDDPHFGDIKKMKGAEDVWRRRVGVYRIFYSIKRAEKIILVFRVERRTSKTYS